MDFRPSTDQKALQEGIRSFCNDRMNADSLHRIAETGGFDRDLWKQLAELGVFQLRNDERRGGLGLGAADAALVFEELGRRLVPGPLVFSELASEFVSGAASGELVVAGLDLMAAASEPHLLEYPDHADLLLLLREDGIRSVEVRELKLHAIDQPLDPLTPIARVESLPEGTRIADAADARRLRHQGMARAAAQLLGIAEATLEIALDYAKQREQFGRTIGSFQAIKHLLADMFARQELARAAVYAAGATLDAPEVGDVETAVRGAKLVASDAAMKNARTCIQIHGGMGYTWEVVDHYYLKRCWVLENSFGNTSEHSLRIAEKLAAQLDEVPDGG